MPEEKKKDPLIDVGETEGADVELESKQEDITHDVIEDSAKSNDTVAQSNEQPVIQIANKKQKTRTKEQIQIRRKN
jgi:hypothetical protein